jgi:hypothetical protein
LCPCFARRGVPDFYLDVFSSSVAQGRYKWPKCYKGGGLRPDLRDRAVPGCPAASPPTPLRGLQRIRI